MFTEANFEIGRILHLRSEIGQSLIGRSNLRFLISGFEVQDSSDFEIGFCEHANLAIYA